MEDIENICNNSTLLITNEAKLTCLLDSYLPPVLISIGTPCNILIILVMRSKPFREISTSFYMTVTAVIDTASLVVALPVHYLYVNFPEIFQHVRTWDSMCIFFNIFGWGTSDLGIFLTVAMTVERAIAIRFPLRALTICSVKKAKRVVVFTFLFECVKLSYFTFKSKVVDATVKSHLCTTEQDYTIENIVPWIHASILAVSYCLMIAGNIIIIIFIRQSSRGKMASVGRRTSRADASANNRQVSLMLVVDSCCLVVCTLPFAVINILIGQFKLLPGAEGGKNLAFTGSFYLLYVNRCLNFFLYCVSGARFRLALSDLCCCISASARNKPMSRFKQRTLKWQNKQKVTMNRPKSSTSMASSLNSDTQTEVTRFPDTQCAHDRKGREENESRHIIQTISHRISSSEHVKSCSRISQRDTHDSHFSDAPEMTQLCKIGNHQSDKRKSSSNDKELEETREDGVFVLSSGLCTHKLSNQMTDHEGSQSRNSITSFQAEHDDDAKTYERRIYNSHQFSYQEVCKYQNKTSTILLQRSYSCLSLSSDKDELTSIYKPLYIITNSCGPTRRNIYKVDTNCDTKQKNISSEDYEEVSCSNFVTYL